MPLPSGMPYTQVTLAINIDYTHDMPRYDYKGLKENGFNLHLFDVFTRTLVLCFTNIQKLQALMLPSFMSSSTALVLLGAWKT